MKYLLIFLVACGGIDQIPDKGDSGSDDTKAESSNDSAFLFCAYAPAMGCKSASCDNQCVNGKNYSCINGFWAENGVCNNPCYCDLEGYRCNGVISDDANSCAHCGVNCNSGDK
jgi:hypothetical protein